MADARLLPIDAIEADHRAQMRTEMDQAKIDRYAEDMLRGDRFPPVVAFGTPEHAYLADGFYRHEAAQVAVLREIEVELHPGGLDDAIWYATGANRAHGIQMTYDDRRRAARVALIMHPEFSDRDIARRVGISHPTVGTIRAALVETGDVEDVTTSRDSLGRQQPRRRASRHYDPQRRNSPVKVTRETSAGYSKCPWCDTLVQPDHVCDKKPAEDPAPRRRPIPQPGTLPFGQILEGLTGPSQAARAGASAEQPHLQQGNTNRLPIAYATITPERMYELLARIMDEIPYASAPPELVAAVADSPADVEAMYRAFLTWYTQFVDALSARARALPEPDDEDRAAEA